MKKKNLFEGGFATPGQLQMYIDHITNIDVVDYVPYEHPKPILQKDLEDQVEDDIEDYADDIIDDEVLDALDEDLEEDLNIDNYREKISELENKIDDIRSKYNGDDGLSHDSMLKISNIRKQYRDWETDRKSTRLNSSHLKLSRMPSSA